MEILNKISFVLLGLTAALDAAGPEQALAILQNRCGSCHSEKSALSGLNIATREALLKGGTRGPAIQPGRASDSILFKAIAHQGPLAMPPGPALSSADVETIRQWIDSGAEWAKIAKSTWWAFQKPVRPTAPATIDSLILARLQTEHIFPSPAATKLALLKRATYDLLGLPPTAAQINSFLADTRPDAWERTLDSLLASPRYGEKWGRYWLDLVRYGDTSGFEQDPYNLEAWRYRDWVIKSFNDDKPYDRFVKEQIAGDELWPEEPDARTGTGYFRVGANRDMLFKVEDQNRVEKLTDYVETTSAVFLGLTVGCARCHDHKFDPIPQKDFYRMQAIFAPLVYDRVFLEYNSGRNYDLAANGREFKLRQIGDQLARIQRPYRDQLRKQKIAKLPPEIRAVVEIPEAKRTPEQQSIATANDPSLKISDDEVRAILSPEDAERLHSIEKRLVSMFANYGPPPMTPSVMDIGREAPRTFIALRGNPTSYGDEVSPGFLTALGGGDVPEPPLHAETTYRRKALAEWMSNENNPLFARVIANRLWRGHFGTGLVRTPSDFGIRAGQPSNRELLDYLATELPARKWSLKAMHRLIMTSEAYRRSADPTPSAHDKDPANDFFSHMNRRRLQSEEIRDAVLQVTGALNLKMGGNPIVPPLEKEELYGIIGNPDNAWSVTPNPDEHNRRSVYMIVRRTFQQPMFEAFDSPDGVLSCPRRNESTTAPQSLALLNGHFMMEQAARLGTRVKSVDDAWQKILGRAPSPEERSAAETFLKKPAPYSELCRALMNLNEFLYVD